MSSPAPNPNVPSIPAPITNPQAVVSVLIPVKRAIDSLAGHSGSPTARAVTFDDLINMGLASAAQVSSPAATANQSLVGLETARAEGVESNLSSAIATETSRAEAAEAGLSAGVSAETARAENAEASLGTSVVAETARAMAAETAETVRAEAAETALSARIGSASGVSKVVAGTGLNGGTITSAGTIGLGTIAAGNLMGNAGTAGAAPSGVAVGAGLSLSAVGTLTNAGVLAVATSSAGISNTTTAGTATLSVEWNAGTVASLGTGLSLSSGTLSAPGSSEWTAGTVSAISSQFSLAAGNTLEMANLGSYCVWAFDGAAGGQPASTNIITLFTGAFGGVSGGKLIAGNGASGPAGLTTTGIGTVGQVLIGKGSGTTPVWQNFYNQETIAATTTASVGTTVYNSALVNIGTSAPTIDMGAGYAGQEMTVHVKQGATAHIITLGTTFVFGTSPSSYTATAVANARDILRCICLDGTHWGVTEITQGFTL